MISDLPPQAAARKRVMQVVCCACDGQFTVLRNTALRALRRGNGKYTCHACLMLASRWDATPPPARPCTWCQKPLVRNGLYEAMPAFLRRRYCNDACCRAYNSAHALPDAAVKAGNNVRESHRRICLKMLVLAHYGGCAVCNEQEPELLAVDHTNNDGAEWRRIHGTGSSATYKHIIEADFPDTFQILCHNHNQQKELRRRPAAKTRGAIRFKRLRITAIQHYGGTCTCCGENNYQTLQLDHRDGGGVQHRRQARFGQLAVWLYQHKWPDGYQVLCANCNMSKSIGGVCIHQRK